MVRKRISHKIYKQAKLICGVINQDSGYSWGKWESVDWKNLLRIYAITFMICTLKKCYSLIHFKFIFE